MDTDLVDRRRLVIIGISSALGSAFARLVLEREATLILGTYRTMCTELRDLSTQYRHRLTLLPLDVEASDAANVVSQELDAWLGATATCDLVYLCGAWVYGELSMIDAESVRRAINVGLVAPILILRTFARTGVTGHAILVCGRSAPSSCAAPFVAASAGLETFVASLARETSAPRVQCTLLSIGLFDKGQSYFSSLKASLPEGAVGTLEDVRDSLFHIRAHPPTGDVIVRAGGDLPDYERVATFLLSRDQAREECAG